MKIALFRFEKQTINFVTCDVLEWEITIWTREKIPLESAQEKWEKYRKVLNEISQIQTKINPNLFAYQSPQKYMGKINEEWYSYWALLSLFCYDNSQKIVELTWPAVRKKLWVNDKDFKIRIQEVKNLLIDDFWIPKSSIIMEWLVYLYLLKNIL
jgi:hypothetical protein